MIITNPHAPTLRVSTNLTQPKRLNKALNKRLNKTNKRLNKALNKRMTQTPDTAKET